MIWDSYPISGYIIIYQCSFCRRLAIDPMLCSRSNCATCHQVKQMEEEMAQTGHIPLGSLRVDADVTGTIPDLVRCVYLSCSHGKSLL